MKLKPSETRKVLLAPSRTRMLDSAAVMAALGAEPAARPKRLPFLPLRGRSSKVEQPAFNRKEMGSIPSAPTKVP
jgi:hypothetical protein